MNSVVKEEKQVYTVTEITRHIRMLLEDTLRRIWVEGEISNYKLHSSGHMYFSLKDRSSVLRCAMFRRANEKLKFELKDGMRVICFGAISVYEPRGDYQLIVRNVEPKGVGALQLQFQQLKEKLLKEGLFDETRKRSIPFLPRRVCIITSPTGAAIRDVMNVSRRRFSNIELIIHPVRVQGESAKHEIAEAIRDMNQWNSTLPAAQKIDAVIVGRGGGSLEDLWAFNEEIVARAVHASDIPVISAVGHEIDYCITDFVADMRAPTPSAAAEMVIPKKEDLKSGIRALRGRLAYSVTAKIDLLKERLASLRCAYALRQPLNLIMQYQQRIDELNRNAAHMIAHLVTIKREYFRRSIEKLEALSPLGILSRGYSITMKASGGTVVKTAQELKKNDRLKTLFAEGSVISKVEEV